MAKVTLDPYLFFKGNCREAMEFYQKALGGKLDLSTYGDTPGMADADPNLIMHSKLETDDFVIMGSDTEKASEHAKKITLSLGGEDEAQLTKIFEDLSEGGEVASPLKKEFWGDTFGQFTDKFGVDWMVNISQKKEE